MQEMNVKQLAERIQSGTAPTLIDVREPNEFAFVHLPDAVLKPLGGIHQWAQELDQDQEYVLYCHTGGRRLAGGVHAGADGLQARDQSERRHRFVVDARRSKPAQILGRLHPPGGLRNLREDQV